MNKSILIGVAVAVVVLVIIGVFVLSSREESQQPAPQSVGEPTEPIQGQLKAPLVEAPAEPETLGGQLYEQSSNPAAKVPETNPFEAQTNPFGETKTNPFEGGYKNPFD